MAASRNNAAEHAEDMAPSLFDAGGIATGLLNDGGGQGLSDSGQRLEDLEDERMPDEPQS